MTYLKNDSSGRLKKMASTIHTPLQSAVAITPITGNTPTPSGHYQQARTPGPDWSQRAMLHPVCSAMNMGEIGPCEAAESFSTILHAYLSYHNIIKTRQTGVHHDRAIIKLTKSLSQIKNWYEEENQFY